MSVYRINKTRVAELVDRTIKEVVEADLTGLTSIGDFAFEGCSSLTSIIIPDSVESIGEWAFYNCSNLSSINNSYFLTSIGASAFRNCIKLAEIVIYPDVESIGANAFYNCTSLTEMILMPSTPPVLESTNAISTATTTIKVPSESVNDYKTATNWSNFASIIVGY